jgi:hypothetical protein
MDRFHRVRIVQADPVALLSRTAATWPSGDLEGIGRPLARLSRKVLEVHALLLPVSAGAVSVGAAALSSRRRRGSERPRIPQAHSPAGLQTAGLRARGLRATSLRATSLRASDRPAPSRTSRRKPRQVSPTNHVPLTSDFRTGSRCALVFRDFPLIGRTTRRNSASPAERLALVYWAPLNRE